MHTSYACKCFSMYIYMQIYTPQRTNEAHTLQTHGFILVCMHICKRHVRKCVCVRAYLLTYTIHTTHTYWGDPVGLRCKRLIRELFVSCCVYGIFAHVYHTHNNSRANIPYTQQLTYTIHTTANIPYTQQYVSCCVYGIFAHVYHTHNNSRIRRLHLRPTGSPQYVCISVHVNNE